MYHLRRFTQAEPTATAAVRLDHLLNAENRFARDDLDSSWHQTWYRFDQRLRVFVLRVIEHVVHGIKLNNFSVLHDSDAIGNISHNTKIMGDEQHTCIVTGLQLFDQFQYLRLSGDIQRCGRLIGDEHLGLQCQCHGDHCPLPLSTRQLMRISAHDARWIRQVNILEQ